jgi:multidrug resistance protein, MATE family
VTTDASGVTHARVLKIALPIVLSNVTVPLLGAVDTGRGGPDGAGRAHRRGGAGRGDPGLGLLDLRLPADGHQRVGRAGAWRGRRGRTVGDPVPRADDRGRGGVASDPAAMALFAAALWLAPGSGAGRGDGARLPCDPHLGRARDHRALCRDRLADRGRTHAGGAGAAAVDQRGQHRAGPVVRAGAGLGRAGRGGGHADRRMVGAGLWPLAVPRGVWPRGPGRLGAGRDAVALRRMASVNGDIMVRSVLLQGSFTTFLFLVPGRAM